MHSVRREDNEFDVHITGLNLNCIHSNCTTIYSVNPRMSERPTLARTEHAVSHVFEAFRVGIQTDVRNKKMIFSCLCSDGNFWCANRSRDVCGAIDCMQRGIRIACVCRVGNATSHL